MCFRPSQIEALKSARIKRCPQCGRENAYSLKKCKFCGTDLDDETAPIAPPSAPEMTSSKVPGVHNLPTLGLTHPDLPGASAIRTNIIGEAVGDQALWRFLKTQVTTKDDLIDCWYNSPVRALVQDPRTKAIVGVTIEREGKLINVAARKGVILASGGFENDPRGIQEHLGLAHTLPTGTLYNEGDGQRMAQGAGARMWHENAWASGGVGLAPEGDRQRSMGTIPFLTCGSVMLVGKDARRFIAEDAKRRAGKVRIGGTWASAPLPDWSCYVFDEAQRADVEQGRVAPPFCGWSETLKDEIDQGKIVTADTLEELAASLDLNAVELKRTVEAFNRSAPDSAENTRDDAGQDAPDSAQQDGARQSSSNSCDALGRETSSMRAFGTGPYYAMPVVPTVLFTAGGPERTAKAEVVDAYGSTIGHLYAVGELGSVSARNVQDGSMLSECLVFGGIAGKEAATQKSFANADLGIEEDLLAWKPGSGDTSAINMRPDEFDVEPEERLGTGWGIGGPLWVAVTLSDDRLSGVRVLRHAETPDIGAPALEVLCDRMVQAGTHDVDVVSGATLTSWGLWHAVEDALNSEKTSD